MNLLFLMLVDFEEYMIETKEMVVMKHSNVRTEGWGVLWYGP